MKRNGFLVGIDPDVSKSGFALLDCEAREFTQVEALTFPAVIDRFAELAAMKADGKAVTVVMEDSDLATNWHYNSRDSKAVCAAKGRSVGLCHATARHLKECAENFGLEVVMMKPLRKFWKGRDGKITHEEAAYFMRGLPKQTNSESRDAALLAWAYADFPIRVKS